MAVGDPSPDAADPPQDAGIGASAGGLDAFKAFFGNMPADSGMAFVLVQHLSPDHKSILTDLIAKATAMPVIEAEDGMPVEPDHVFVIPPDATLTLHDRRLQVARPAPPRERRRPIDTFFASLAEDQSECAVCIVLSGTGSDGSLGLKTIKENGGLTLAQAEFDHTAMSGMPHSAAATGLVDHVLPVEDMPAKLLEYQRHLGKVATRKGGDGTRTDTAEHLAAISALLRGKTGHDFSKYKDKTMVRRIQRRMQVLQTDTVPAYVARLREDPRQIDLLFRELLIGVTQFFRDPDAFDALRALIATLLERRRSDDPVRVWVAGCATGEEAYSIAILLKEEMERRGTNSRAQIFGTDIDDNAVAFARAGRYRKTAGLSPERLERFFVDDGDEFCPVKVIREMCVFSTHSVVKDPPFSKLDLISCRNLLIYMEAELQDRVLRTFHYALSPDGLLLLGPSEGVSRHAKLFATLDKKHHLFQRRDADAAFLGLPFAAATQPPAHSAGTPTLAAGEDRLDRSARRALAKHSPAYVVIDKHHTILRFSGGEAGRYIEPSAGPASLNLFSNLRKTLRPIVRTAVQTALATKEPAVHDDVALRIDGQSHSVTVIVEPLADGGAEAGLCVVAFWEGASGVNGNGPLAPSEAESANARALEHELRTTRMQLQATINELETANEEMKSAGEEYQSVNEELQSSNEELETSKEEMQSINEELHTINAEMANKNEMLTRLNSDLKNLLESTQIATMFLDNDLRIKNFTPGMVDIFHLREGDRGRPITEIVTRLGYDDLRRDVRKVLRELVFVERQVEIKEAGPTFIMRIRPYRTVDNLIDGVVITFVDISERKKAEDHTALLMGELDHRVKNILAIVSSVISQTLKTSATPGAFAAAIEGRIAAIARAHGLLTQKGKREEASLGDIVATELAPFERRGNALTITGPDVVLTPKAGLALAMAIHELASNAAKYGSLSRSAGRLAVTWQSTVGAANGTLNLAWRELDGPPVKPPAQRGFGTILIERSLAHEFDATVKREFLPSGLVCTIDIPLTAEVGYTRLPPRDGGEA